MLKGELRFSQLHTPRSLDNGTAHASSHEAPGVQPYKYHRLTAEDLITSHIPTSISRKLSTMSNTDPPPWRPVANPTSMTDEPLNLLLAMNLLRGAFTTSTRTPPSRRATSARVMPPRRTAA